MRRTLIRHPDYPCEAVSRLDAEVERPSAHRLRLRYVLSGVTGGLVLPAAASGRADELWKHTCFEAFVRPAPGEAYRELNYSPGGRWAAYRFDRRREGMAEAQVSAPAAHATASGADILDLALTWDLDLPGKRPWRVGLSAVIEETGGRLSYWALAHPAGRPDFHDPDCFTLELPAPEAA